MTHTFTANGSFDFVATDAAGNVTTSTVTLTNIDKEAPVLGLQANITQEATSSAGAVVTFTVNSIDNVDVASLANCSSTSGSVFPNGTTTVTCTKTDASGNAAEPRIFTIEVVDTTAPTVGAASDIVVSTSGANGIVTYTAPTATDLVDGDVPVFCTPASGSSFPLNTTTTVTCTATDSHGKIGSSSFDVIASDTGAPTLVIPGNMTVEATSANGAVVVFVATATDDIDASPLVSCTPASGSTFPLGTTTVSCSASDNAETPNTANGTFTITIVDTTLPVITLLGDSPMILIVGTPYVEPGATVSDGNATLTVTPDVSGTVDSNTLGTYTLTYTVKDAAGNSAEPKTRTVQVIATDTTPPVISEVTPVPHPTNILTPSYTFTTNEAGTITHGGSCSSTTTSAIIGDNILTFKALTEGYYSDCTLTVKDAANNTSTVLAISPFAIDTTPPVITLTGAATMTLTVGGTYTEEGATANDGESSLKVAITGSVNTGIPGTYVLTYTATDSAGNSASITRTVQVDAVVVVPPENTGGGGGGAPSVVYACRDPEATNYKTSGV